MGRTPRTNRREIGDGYPKRSSHFAHKAVRLLFKSCAAQDIGQNACLLICHIAHTEDAARYQGPVRFWNGQLMETLGFRSPKQLTDARTQAMEAGWLHYERDGNRSVGRYWVMVPSTVTQFDDSPIEPIDANRSAGGTNNGTKTKRKAERERNGTRNENVTESGKPSYPLPDPAPLPEKREPAGAGAPAELLALIDHWNQLGNKIVKPGNGARRDPPAKAVLKGWTRAIREPELRPVIQDVQALVAAIPRARFCHGQGWFTLPWIFGRNQNGEWNAVKLVNGAFDDASGNHRGRIEMPTGTGHKHGSARVDTSGF